MKRAELIIGKAYYTSTSADWRDGSGDNSYFKTAQRRKHCRVVIVETQLKTDYERKFRTRDVLIQNSNGQEKWIPLKDIRCDWSKAVKLLTQDSRNYRSYDDRARRYERHLQRKHDREVYQPALKAMLKMIEEHEGGYVSQYTAVSGAFSVQQLNAIIEGLTLLKTQQPVLKEVA